MVLFERTNYGQIARSFLAVTVQRLGFSWWQVIVLVDWRVAEKMMLPSLQKNADVIVACLGASYSK